MAAIRPPKPQLEIVKSEPEPLSTDPPIIDRRTPILDYPECGVLMPRDDGDPAFIRQAPGEPQNPIVLNVGYVPWLQTLDRKELETALIEEDTEKSLNLATELSNPINGSIPISGLASRAGIRIPELMEIWHHHKQIAAVGIALSGAPVVAAHTILDAQSQTVCCPRCDGGGVIRVMRKSPDGPDPVQTWIDCHSCSGTGTIRKPGDAKSREWVLKCAGVIKPDGPMIVNNNNANTISASSVLDELERYTTINVATIPDDDA